MRGQILGVDRRTGDAQVAGEDGLRYAFHRDDWAPEQPPAIGLEVDFTVVDGRARQVFPLPSTIRGAGLPATAAGPATDRNKYVAALLAFFFGPLGVDRFYLGKTGSGIVMLVLSITIVGLMLSYPVSLINMIRYLVMGDREFAARYPRG